MNITGKTQKALLISDFGFRILTVVRHVPNFSVFRLLFSVFCLLSSVFCLFLLSGCAKEQQIEIADKGICVAGLDKPAVMQVAEDVLAEMHFAIEKSDANNGLIRTHPLPGAQFFEFWRSDNVGTFNSAEANLHSIRRIVELRISQPPPTASGDRQSKDVSVNCVVKVERLSLPEQEVSSSSRAYKMFSTSTSAMQKIRFSLQQQAGMAWVDLGQDKPLEAEILKRISSMLDARCSSLGIEYRESSIE
jgi:hypothetical protein